MTKMPDWELPSTEGGTVSSKDLEGAPYIIYFYPRDLTPGCTTAQRLSKSTSST